jgi:hypothetical protein
VNRAPQHGEHGIIAQSRQRRIGPRADIADRATDDDVFGQFSQGFAAKGDEMGQEDLAQILKTQPFLKQGRVFEIRVGRNRLERLQKARALRKIQELGDGPGPGCVRQRAPASVILPETQG